MDWAEERTDELLAKTMGYSNSQGHTREHPVWLAVAHLFNHQTHHRGQITTLLHQLDHTRVQPITLYMCSRPAPDHRQPVTSGRFTGW